jgi:Tol biopolymer transport system component
VYSPDGRIAWVSDRSGSREIWICRSDGSGQTQVTRFNGPEIDHLQWSPDGRRLLFDSRPHGDPSIFLMDCGPAGAQCGQPERVSTASPGESPSWSADGQFIYFVAKRQASSKQIWRIPTPGGRPVQVTLASGYTSRESFDGKWLYFSRSEGGIWWVPGSKSGRIGGIEELVIGPPYRVRTEGWTLGANEITFIDRPAGDRPAAIRAYGLATEKVRSIMNLSEVFPDRGEFGVSASPDGRWILYSQLDRSGSNIIVADVR